MAEDDYLRIGFEKEEDGDTVVRAPSFPIVMLGGEKVSLKLHYHSLEAFINAREGNDKCLKLLQQHEDAFMNFTRNTIGSVSSDSKMGSAFFIAPTLIASTQQLLSEPAVLFNISHMATARDAWLEERGQLTFPRVIPEEEHAILVNADASAHSTHTTGSHCYKLKHHANFNFGILKTPTLPNTNFLTPFCGDIVPGLPIAILGYPDRRAAEPWDENDEGEDPNFKYIDSPVSALVLENIHASLFRIKHIACGRILEIGSCFITHTVTTGFGICGAPVVPLDHPTTFCAIHMKGWIDNKKENIAISVDHPNFVLMYAKYVAPFFKPIPSPVAEYLHKHRIFLRKHVTDLHRDVCDIIEKN